MNTGIREMLQQGKDKPRCKDFMYMYIPGFQALMESDTVNHAETGINAFHSFVALSLNLVIMLSSMSVINFNILGIPMWVFYQIGSVYMSWKYFFNQETLDVFEYEKLYSEQNTFKLDNIR